MRRGCTAIAAKAVRTCPFGNLKCPTSYSHQLRIEHAEQCAQLTPHIAVVGWGVPGFCPGRRWWRWDGEAKAIAFVIALLLGMGLFELLERRTAAIPPRLA